MASTFIRAFAVMLALTGFSATTFSSGTSGTISGGIHKTMGGPGMGGGPISTCAPTSANCGLD